MGDLQNLASNAVELIVTVSVATLVWITVMAGLYQLIRERIRRFHRAGHRPVREGYVQRIDAGRQALSHPPAAGH